MSFQNHWNSCRKIACGKVAVLGRACCCKEHRDSVPTCDVLGCDNAVEMSITNGMGYYEKKCYVHGGRTHFDGNKQDY